MGYLPKSVQQSSLQRDQAWPSCASLEDDHQGYCRIQQPRDLSSFQRAIKPQVSCLCMCAVSTPGDLREGHTTNSDLFCLPELSGFGDFTDTEMSAHRDRWGKKTRISLCKHAVWLERVEEGSVQAVLWVTAFILLHYLQEQFWQVQQMDRLRYVIEISDKAECCQNNIVRISVYTLSLMHFDESFHCTHHDPSHMSYHYA